MAKYKLVVLDMAGTTVVDKGNVAAAFIEAFQFHGIKLGKEEVNFVMGWRKIDAITKLLTDQKKTGIVGGPELINSIHTRFENNMVAFYKADPDLAPLPYAEELFSKLRSNGVKVGLNTGFTKPIAQTIVDRLNWNDKIDVMVASDEVPEGRPYPYMIEKMKALFGVENNAEVVKVGDTEVDVQEGRNAQCGLVVSVTTGAYTKEQLASYQPDEIIDSLAALEPMILE